MGLINGTFLQKFSGVLRWLDDEGTSVKATTLSDTSVMEFCWGVDGDYFFTASNTSTGRIEKWARDGTAYTWRRTGIDTFGQYCMAADSSDNLYICKQDDVYILGASDGLTDYSDIGNELSGYNPGAMAVDSSGNCFIATTGSTDCRLFKFNNTLTKQWETQIASSAYACHEIALDSSGNIFVAHDNGVEKFNSSGTSQWSYHPHASSYGNVTDVKIANSGKIYGCQSGNGSYVFRLTDNGTSSTEDWSVDHSGDPQSIAKITVNVNQVVCYPSSGSYDVFAVDESDGTTDTGFTSYDVGNEILCAHNDPLASITVGALTITEAVQYSRWVLTGGTISDCGPLQTTEEVTVRGYGNELIDKLYFKGNYSNIGTPTPRYENFAMVGDPPSEDFGIKAYEYQTYTYNVQVDSDYNQYIMVYRYYTADAASAASSEYYTSAGSYWSVQKWGADGVFVWESDIPIGGIDGMTIDLDYAYVYIFNGYTSGAIQKISCETGEYYTDTYWPIDVLDTFDSIEPNTFKVGRDNKLYFFMYDYSDSSLPYLYKYNLDGTKATNWSTPYALPQGGTGTSPNCIDVTDDGTIAIGAIKVGDTGEAIHVVNSGKTEDWRGDLPGGDNPYGCDHILIHDSDEYVIAESYSGIRKITGETSGICDVSWTVSDNTSTGEGILFNPFWSHDQDYFYAYSSFIASEWSIRKYAYSDGAVQWKTHADDDTELSTSAVAPIPVPAWGITVTFGSNGIVKTYYNGTSDSGSPLTSGDVIYAEAGKDFTFAFVGDTGYYVDEVTVDSVNLGYRSNYTFTNVLNNHTIHVTFGTGFPSGPFTYQYSMTGGILDTFSVGALSESYALRDPVLRWFIVAGPHQETHAIIGEGYLPFDISLLYLINKHRSDNSVASVVEDPRGWLLDGAEYAVADMIANGSLTLTLVQIMGQDGANYPYLYAAGIPTIADTSFTPQQIFNAWVADGPTEAIILDEDYEEIGIYVEEYDGDNYIFALFAQWHPQYTVVRADEHWNMELSVPTNYFFDFLSPDEYQKLLDNTSPVKLPRYSASVGDYELTGLISFSYRLEVGTPSYLTLTCRFSYDIFEEINTRKDDGMSIESVLVSSGQEVRNEVISVDFSEVELIAGENPRLSLSGYSDLHYYNTTAPLRHVMTRTKDENGKTRFRCSQPDFYLRPGCIATYGSYSITVEKIVITVSNGVTQYMDITGE